MQTRVLVPEVMDDPELDRRAHFHALRGLQRINRLTGAGRLAWGPIRRLARELGRDRLSILDVATGAGDVPIDLCRRAAREGVRLDVEACDFSDKAREFAAENFRRAQLEIPLFSLDVLEDSIERPYDVVMCSTFLHHFTEEQVVVILRSMLAAATHRVLVIDLVRGRMNWWQVWLASHVLTRSKVVHFDGPQSIRAAFTVAEMRALAERAGMCDLQIRGVWPCRLVMVGRRGE
ncbi:MAG: methyltransferase domain-containing protein [Pirellulaceae bacterium]